MILADGTGPWWSAWKGFVVAALVGIAPAMAQAHADDIHCEAVAKSIADAGFGDKVTVTCNDGHALIASDTYPDHPLMTGIA